MLRDGGGEGGLAFPSIWKVLEGGNLMRSIAGTEEVAGKPVSSTRSPSCPSRAF